MDTRRNDAGEQREMVSQELEQPATLTSEEAVEPAVEQRIIERFIVANTQDMAEASEDDQEPTELSGWELEATIHKDRSEPAVMELLRVRGTCLAIRITENKINLDYVDLWIRDSRAD